MLDPEGIRLLEVIAQAADGSLGAAIFFGSRSSGVATTAASAHDLMLVCDHPRLFYRCCHQAGLLQRSPIILAALDTILAPTQIRLAREPWVVKASVVSAEALDRATSPARADQFLAGRLFQDVHVVWARDPAYADRISAAIQSARRVTLNWVAPDLPRRFSPADYVRQLFRTSFQFEVRPETRGRADALFTAQRERLVPIFEPVLASLANDALLRMNADGAYSLPVPIGRGARLRRRAFLELSRLRATARWPKHAITFDGWLDYIIRKAERHSGETITLSPIERRLPFVFLWPRALRFLIRQRRKSGTG